MHHAMLKEFVEHASGKNANKICLFAFKIYLKNKLIYFAKLGIKGKN